MADETIHAGNHAVPVYVAQPPAGDGPFPGVVVVHDALGMTTDLRHQADWLAGEGYLAAAPDLYSRGSRLRCLFATMREATRGAGAAFDDLEATRSWLAGRPQCTGRVGVIGFCMGGGFALLLAAGRGYAASAVNYGALPSDPGRALEGACPIVASYGAKDRTLRNAPARLRELLSAKGVDHDVVVYPDAGHGFMNDHAPGETPIWALVMGAAAHTGYHEPSARDARERIVAFFDRYLGSPAAS